MPKHILANKQIDTVGPLYWEDSSNIMVREQGS